MARPYQEYGSFSYGSQSQEPTTTEEALQVTSGEYQQQLLTQSFHPPHPYIQSQSQAPSQEYSQHAVTPMLPSQISAPEPAYGLDQSQIVPSQMQRQMSQVSSSQYGTPYETPEMVRFPQSGQDSVSRKRSHPGDDYGYEYQGLQQLHTAGGQIPVEMHGHPGQMQHPGYPYQVHDRSTPPHGAQLYHMPQQQHHHHRLPNQPPPSKQARFGGYEQDSDDHGPPSVVGQPGMPEPAPRPKGPKLKFTSEDDALLVELKETKNLTWKQIADFFPGRSSGTLQVRYCTKLKAKTTVWTDDMIHKLRAAMEEYDNDRWRIISGKVGNGFSAGACKEKAAELNGEEIEDDDAEQLPLDDGPVSATASIHDREPYQDPKYLESREPYRMEPNPYHRETEVGCVIPTSTPIDAPSSNAFIRYNDVLVA